MIPADRQSEAFTKSKYFQIAGSFAEPIEALIPEETLDIIRKKTAEAGLMDEPKEEDKDNKDSNKDTKEDKKETAKSTKKSETEALFEKFVQPQIEKKKTEVKAKIKENFEGYNPKERNNLDRLIETTAEDKN